MKKKQKMTLKTEWNLKSFYKSVTDPQIQKDVEKVIHQYVQKGEINSEKSNHIKDILDKIVNHPTLTSFYSEGFTVFNEREIVSENNHIVIPDRLVFNSKNEAVIIDYKTGKPSNSYHQQLITYEDVLKSMHIKVIKKLLIYMNEQITIEEI